MTNIPYSQDKVNITSHNVLRLPHSKLHQKSDPNKYTSACPFCNQGKDRFYFWADAGNFWCNVCNQSGFVSDAPESPGIPSSKPGPDPSQKEKHKTIISRLEAKGQADRYHAALNPSHREYLHTTYGLTNDSINEAKLGYVSHCPTCPRSDSISIPYYWTNGRVRLLNLRHRLLAPEHQTGDKYRPEQAGMTSTLFNIDLLLDKTEPIAILLEGEFKALVLKQFYLPAVAISGLHAWDASWAKYFEGKEVYIALDPGEKEHGKAIEYGRAISNFAARTYICTLPFKPDDMLIKMGYDIESFSAFLEMGRRL